MVSGGFLQGYGLHLNARAQGFNSDAAVWQALQTHPNYALIDNTAVLRVRRIYEELEGSLYSIHELGHVALSPKSKLAAGGRKRALEELNTFAENAQGFQDKVSGELEVFS